MFPTLIPSVSPVTDEITSPFLTNFNEEVVKYRSLQGLLAEPKSNKPLPLVSAWGINEPVKN